MASFDLIENIEKRERQCAYINNYNFPMIIQSMQLCLSMIINRKIILYWKTIICIYFT